MSEENPNIESYLALLNDAQKEAVVHEGSPLLILAGAGSGKTRVITTKIAYQISKKGLDPHSILSVTFTKKAATEMKDRAVAIEPRAKDAQIRTFHSFGSWFLRKFAEYSGLEKNFTVYDDNDMAILLEKACNNLSDKDVKLLVHQISLANDYCLGPQADLSILGSEYDLNQIYSDYTSRLRSTGNADFGDLIMLPVLVMQKYPQIADYIHRRFKVILVDEYQDSNIAQYRLLQELSGIKDGFDTYVCVVGDDDQSIYHFRGAEVQNILTFPDKFPGTKIIKLETNYRSTSKILRAASLVVSKNHDRLGKELIADRGEGSQPVLVFLGDQGEEAKFCADLILKAKEETNSHYSDWALLYRTNAQSLNFEKEFIHRKIPYKVVGSLKFYEREEIKDLLAYLSLIVNPRDEISFRRVVNKPSRGIGEKTQDLIFESAIKIVEVDGQEQSQYTDLIEAAQNMAPQFSKKAREGALEFVKLFNILKENFRPDQKLSDFVERVFEDSGLKELHKTEDEIEGTQRVLNMQELANSAVIYDCSVEGLVEFLDAINLDRTMEPNDDNVGDDAVTLITVHNTKGLEYNKVIITGLEEGVFPRQDKNFEEMEEERRLFYVGITRAKDDLFITSASKRCLYGRWEYMKPSPFIIESKAAFKILGHKPFGFGGNAYSSDSVDSDLLDKWKKGSKVFHDDYGYGYVINSCLSNSEFVIEVKFESGSIKKFLPKYQKNTLTLIKD